METNRRGLLNRKWIIAFLVYIGLIAVCCVALYVVPSVMGMLERTYIAEYGTIDVKDEVSGFIVRDEIVYKAAEKSEVKRAVEENTLVKAGTRVVKLTPMETSEGSASEETAAEGEAASEGAQAAEGEEAAEDTAEVDDTYENLGKYASIMEELGDAAVETDSGVTNNAGYVSYYVDGAETKLSTANIENLTQKDLKKLTDKRAVKTPSGMCGKNYPVFKIIRNRKWYLVYYLSNEDAEKYAEGDTVSINVNGDDVSVTVKDVTQGSKNSRIILTCKTFFDGFFETRTLDTKVTVVSAEGLVLEDASIIEAPDGKRGVFVKDKLGNHVFTPVRTKADDGVKCVVYSDIYVDDEGNYVETIGTYDEIIAEPSQEDIDSLKAGSTGN